jgi:MFS family permease
MVDMIAPHAGQAKALIVICLASFAWAFSFGEGAPLISIWLKHENCGDTLIGLNTAVYYGGLALAAMFVPSVMRRRGPGCAGTGMACSGLAMLALPCQPAVCWWFVLRFASGVAGAFSLIPLETYVNRDLPGRDRARNFSLYAVSLTLGWAAGNWVGLELVVDHMHAAFVLGACGALGGAVLIKMALPPATQHVKPATRSRPLQVRANLLGFGAAWSQGFLEGGMVAFMSLYLLGIGLTEVRAAWLTSTTMVGVIAFQVPVAWVADRWGRVQVLLVCYGMTALGLVALPLAGASPALPVWLFVVGAFSGALYPLGLAALGDRLPSNELDRANAAYLSLESIGSLVGPAMMGLARDLSGDTAMFAVGNAAVLVVPAAWLISRKISKAESGSATEGLPSRQAA